MKCENCGGNMIRSKSCGVKVCQDCSLHEGLVRCYCGWASSGGNGYNELIEMGETIEEDQG
jgi:hypothetical protein